MTCLTQLMIFQLLLSSIIIYNKNFKNDAPFFSRKVEFSKDEWWSFKFNNFKNDTLICLLVILRIEP